MSKAMKSNGSHHAKAGTLPTNRVADSVSRMSAAAETQPAEAEAQPSALTGGKTGKMLLGLGAAVVAIIATEYALRRFTKTGGIIPHLIRLEKLSRAYLATVEKP